MRKLLATAAVTASLLTGAGVGSVALGVAGAQEAPAGTTDSAQAPRSPVQWVKDALAGLVSDGTINQAQSDKIAATLEAAKPERGPGGPGRGGGGRIHLSAAATALGMTEEELHTELHSGKTPAQIAEAKNVSRQTLVDALVAAENQRIDAAVADGRLTAEQAAEKKTNVTARVEAFVDGARPMGKPGGRHPMGPPPAGAAAPTPAEGTSL